MKTRVIIKNRKFVPQVRNGWWDSWDGICIGISRRAVGLYNEFDTMEEAIADLEKYKNQLVDDGKVVWKGE